MNLIKYCQSQIKTLILGYRFIQVVKDPYGAFGSINKLADAIKDDEAIQLLAEHLAQTPEGKETLETRYLPRKTNLEYFRSLPSNTLGYLYAEFMDKNGLIPPPIRDNIEDLYLYICTYISDTHDIWHVVTGSEATKAGELKVETFSLVQFYPTRFWVALLSKNLLKTAIQDLDLSAAHMEAIVRGWIMGIQAQPLFGAPWDELWEIPIDEVRRIYNIQTSFSPEIEAAISWRGKETKTTLKPLALI